MLANRRSGTPQRLPDLTKMPSWQSKMRFPFLSVPMPGGGGVGWGGGREGFVAFNTSFIGLVCLSGAVVTQCCVLSVPTPSRILCLRGGRFSPTLNKNLDSHWCFSVLSCVLSCAGVNFIPGLPGVSYSPLSTLWKFACSDVTVLNDRMSILDFSLYFQSGGKVARTT